MMLTLLMFSGAVAISALFVAVGDTFEAAPSLAGEATAVGLADPAADTLVGHNESATTHLAEWHLKTVAALCDAEDFLDSLEAQGIAERELLVLGNSCFAIRWRAA
jgi:hypothetical protein